MFVVNLSQDISPQNKYLSNTLLSLIEEKLEKKEKIILYLNKRGEFSSLICSNCSHIFRCEHCDVSMSIHRDIMICHICGERKKLPKNCSKCGNTKLEKVGVGTIQIETALKNIFPGKNIFRFDTDNVKNKTEKKQALEILTKADIIIGTKMITTGFDFENVGLIGVLLVEQELQIAKYNAEEQLYANITQLLGRGGRKGKKTDFLLQTYIPNNEIIRGLSEKNYKDFFLRSLQERKLFSYPPFCEFATIEYRHKDQEKALAYIKKIQKILEENKQQRTEEIELFFSPEYFRKYNQFYYKILIKGKNIREFLSVIKKELFSNPQLIVIFEE